MCGAGWAGGTLEPAGMGSFQPPPPRVLTLSLFHTHTHSHKMPAQGFERTEAGKGKDANNVFFILFSNSEHIYICCFCFVCESADSGVSRDAFEAFPLWSRWE